MKTLQLKNLGVFRHKKNMTQETLATISGLSIRTIKRAENGESVTVETAKCIASAFDFSSVEEMKKAFCNEFKAKKTPNPVFIFFKSSIVNLLLSLSALAVLFGVSLAFTPVQGEQPFIDDLLKDAVRMVNDPSYADEVVSLFSAVGEGFLHIFAILFVGSIFFGYLDACNTKNKNRL